MTAEVTGRTQWARLAHPSTSGCQFEPAAWTNLKSGTFERNRRIDREQGFDFLELY